MNYRLKPVVYYLARFFVWYYLGGGLLGLVIERLNLIARKFFRFDPIILTYAISIIISVFFIKIAFDKVFFKPYKHIMVTPSFEKVTVGFVVNFLATLLCSCFAIALFVYVLKTVVTFIAQINFNGVQGLITFIAAHIVLFSLVHIFVKDHAVIDTKA